MIALTGTITDMNATVITSDDALDALPAGAVILDKNGIAWQRYEGTNGWMNTKDEWTETWALLNYGPLTLIHTPKEPA